ncbi:HlyD family efflux transporter periplasmic adaptor subunit [Pedobacter sp. WC2423]|uniref:HlyD family efflux transporter periplasmic adaptor subunit n=1 Tax=Pedobacter sp. WC2423 TaxID=3234142 RepID=UPI003465C0D7
MPENLSPFNRQNSDEIEEIITSVPSWIVRSGTMIIFTVIAGIVLMSAFIKYPDIVNTSLKVNSLNSPKRILSKQRGKLVRILVTENQFVKQGQPVAYLESTADHTDVIRLLKKLKQLRTIAPSSTFVNNFESDKLNLGELQSAYEVFYQSYLQFNKAIKGGHYSKQKIFLEKDLNELRKLTDNINQQKKIQEKQIENAELQYKAYIILRKKGVISNNEFKEQENKYLSSKYPLLQNETSLSNNNTAYLAKQKELLDLDNTIMEQRLNFIQALNGIITETESWLMHYVLSAPVDGIVGFSGIIQENQNVNVNDELFFINPVNARFFGEVAIPQYSMGKIKLGQKVLIKLQSYPFEEFGMIHGEVNYLSEVALKDSVFIAKVDFKDFENKDASRKIVLKSGMLAEAKIITRESSLLARFSRSITKIFEDGR